MIIDALKIAEQLHAVMPVKPVGRDLGMTAAREQWSIDVAAVANAIVAADPGIDRELFVRACRGSTPPRRQLGSARQVRLK